MNPLSLLGGWKGYVAIALVAGVAAASLTIMIKNGEIARIERDQARVDLETTQAALVQFHETASNINAKALEFSAIKDHLNSRFGTLSKDLQHAIANAPLPDDCRPDPVRVRVLEDAIAAANNTATGR